MNDTIKPDDASPIKQEVDELRKQIAVLAQQVKTAHGAARTDRQVLDTIESNLLVIYKTIDARLSSIEKSVAVPKPSAEQDKAQ